MFWWMMYAYSPERSAIMARAGAWMVLLAKSRNQNPTMYTAAAAQRGPMLVLQCSLVSPSSRPMSAEKPMSITETDDEASGEDEGPPLAHHRRAPVAVVTHDRWHLAGESGHTHVNTFSISTPFFSVYTL